MADTKRQQIITAVDTRLKTIKTTAGYQTNAGNAVYDWLHRQMSATSLLAIVYRDSEESIEAETVGTIGYHRRELNMELEIMVANGSTTMETMRKVLADIETAIGTDTRWSGLAIRTNPGRSRIEVDQESKIVSGGLLTFSIVYQTRAWNAYT